MLQYWQLCFWICSCPTHSRRNEKNLSHRWGVCAGTEEPYVGRGRGQRQGAEAGAAGIYCTASISAVQHSDPAVHTHALSRIAFHPVLSRELGYGSLCCRVGCAVRLGNLGVGFDLLIWWRILYLYSEACCSLAFLCCAAVWFWCRRKAGLVG